MWKGNKETQPGKKTETPLPSFQVQIEDIDNLVKSINDGHTGEIGKSFLPGDIEQIECDVESDTNEFNLRAELFTDAKFFVSYTDENAEFEKKGQNYVFKGAHGSGFVITQCQENDSKAKYILISNAHGWDVRGEGVDLLDLPSRTPEVIKNNLLDFCQAIEKVVKFVDGNLHNTKLILSDPTESEDDNLEDLRGAVDLESPEVDFDEIGGQGKARQELESFAYALTNPDIYRKWGTKPPKGILLYGPSGTGKTLLAKALSFKARAEFIHVKASDVGTKWFGESEKLVQRIFDAADSRKGKTIIFFDELDAIAPSRNGLSTDNGGDQASIRIISTIMENLDGLSSSSKVFVIGATNRPNAIDEALKRPGRLDRIVEVPLPDEKGRKEIFDIHMKKANTIARRELFQTIEINRLGIESENFSGADIAEIIRRTLEAKLKLEIAGRNPEPVKTEDILLQIFNYERHKKN